MIKVIHLGLVKHDMRSFDLFASICINLVPMDAPLFLI